MNKKVFVFMRDLSQLGERIHFELKEIYNIPNIGLFTPTTAGELFRDFVNNFNVKTFPCVQIGENNGKQWTTIHMDPNHEEQTQGAGGKQIRDFIYIKVSNVDELVNKALEIYKS